MREGLAAALADGDRKGIIEILQGWVAALNSRFTMGELETLMGIVKAAKSAVQVPLD